MNIITKFLTATALLCIFISIASCIAALISILLAPIIPSIAFLSGVLGNVVLGSIFGAVTSILVLSCMNSDNENNSAPALNELQINLLNQIEKQDISANKESLNPENDLKDEEIQRLKELADNNQVPKDIQEKLNEYDTLLDYFRTVRIETLVCPITLDPLSEPIIIEHTLEKKHHVAMEKSACIELVKRGIPHPKTRAPLNVANFPEQNCIGNLFQICKNLLRQFLKNYEKIDSTPTNSQQQSSPSTPIPGLISAHHNSLYNPNKNPNSSPVTEDSNHFLKIPSK